MTVVIPTFNRVSKLESCLNSLLDSAYENLQIIVVNDGSTDSTIELLKKFGEVQVINHEKPKFKGHSINDGIRSASFDYVIVIDDDNVVDRLMVTELLRFMQSYPHAGVAGPVTYYLSSPNTIMYAGARLSRHTRMTTFLCRDQTDTGRLREPFEVDNIPNCFMVRRELALRVGLIDADLLVWGGEDGSLQDKIARIGYGVFVVPSAKTFHDRETKQNDKAPRLTSAKLYYLMRGKTAYVKLYESSRVSRMLFVCWIPVYLLYYCFLVIKFVPGIRPKVDRMLILVKAAVDGWKLRGGMPFA